MVFLASSPIDQATKNLLPKDCDYESFILRRDADIRSWISDTGECVVQASWVAPEHNFVGTTDVGRNVCAYAEGYGGLV